MANSGQPGSFSGEDAGEVDIPLYMNTGTDCDDCDPKKSFDISELFGPPQNPTMGIPSNIQQWGQPAGKIRGTGFRDQTNTNVQRSDTFDSQHVQRQPVGMSHQIGFPGEPSSDNDVRRTGTLKLTAEQAEKKRESDKAYRARKKKEKIEMESKLKELAEENKNLKIEIAELKHANVTMSKDLAKLKSDHDKLKQHSEKQNAIERKLLKIKDFKEFINEGSKHCKEPTQDQFPSDEERHSEELFAAPKPVAVDGDDFRDENGDSKRKKKHAAPSAPSGRRGGKVPRVVDMDDELIETRPVTSAAKRVFFDARADQRQESTSNPTAMVIDPYSITECLRILNTMGGIPYSIVKKARAKFKSRDEREYFVGLTDEDWRRGWVKDLEDS